MFVFPWGSEGMFLGLMFYPWCFWFKFMFPVAELLRLYIYNCFLFPFYFPGSRLLF